MVAPSVRGRRKAPLTELNFMAKTTKSETLTFCPLSFGHVLVLEDLESPFFGEGVPTAKDIGRALFVLTRPAADSRKLLSESREQFEAAAFEFCGGIPAAELGTLGPKLQEHLAASLPPLPSEKQKKH